MVKDAIKSNNLPHFIFAGPAGTGKTSLAYAIANELDADVLYLNCSLNTSIDDIRASVVGYSSSVSLSGGSKIVILDEMEGMSANAANSLKGIYEQFPNVRFIATTNHLGKVIDALKSRSVVIEFKIDGKEKPKLAMAMFKRSRTILDERGITYDPKVVAEVVNKFFPDFRRTLNELQRYSSSGSIDSGILLNQTKTSYRELVKALSEKDFKAMRTWVGENSGDDPSNLFRDFYDNCMEYVEPASVPSLILLLADYQFKATHAVDQQINTSAFLVETMVSLNFKAM
jgi:DNA polymerase III delta prime subunit